ncbi:MAG: pyridoxal phosphate-dependent aminotransferase [Planctomycetota bacterium]|nr:pyridoxal phosphate-dependent aminotransferase [Planctomycetota bacterium]MDP7245545.1 pyridoxal phosphate-dependent aminotransferase [Planctomycetota bacterium]
MTVKSPQQLVRIPNDCGSLVAERGFSTMAQSMVGSSILKVGNEIRELLGKGVDVANMTVGDFSPTQFPIPPQLTQELLAAIGKGDTNYPPPAGLWELRDAVRQHIARTQGLEYPMEGITIVSGGRPTLYSTYRLLVNPGELVLFPLPSWNNHNYRDAAQVRVKGVACGPETAFQPTVDQLKPHISEARLLVLNTPQNPSGGVMSKETVADFGSLLVEENLRREKSGEKPLYLLFDQIYRSLVFPGHEHYSPVQLVPECAPFVIHTDGISKGFAATGLRCGWMFGPPAIAQKMTALLTHVGAWAPKPVQQATANFLLNTKAVDSWDRDMVDQVRQRLDALHDIMQALKEEGYPVDYIEPQGAIYMSLQFRLAGLKTPEGDVLENNEAIRSFLLQKASFALVGFSAFGVEPKDLDGWFRGSVGAVSVEDIQNSLPKLRTALASLS